MSLKQRLARLEAERKPKSKPRTIVLENDQAVPDDARPVDRIVRFRSNVDMGRL